MGRATESIEYCRNVVVTFQLLLDGLAAAMSPPSAGSIQLLLATAVDSCRSSYTTSWCYDYHCHYHKRYNHHRYNHCSNYQPPTTSNTTARPRPRPRPRPPPPTRPHSQSLRRRRLRTWPRPRPVLALLTQLLLLPATAASPPALLLQLASVR